MKSNIKSISVLVATAVATAAINYSILHNPFVFIVILVLIAHELGHYYTALSHGAKPDIPYIIPLPFIAIGITRIKNFKKLSTKVRKAIVFNGPLTGIITAFLIFLYLLLNPIVLPAYALLVVFAEAILNYFGSDGKKYRQIKKEELLCTF